MNLRRSPASDANNVRSVITFLGLALFLALSIAGWLVYVILSKPPEKELPPEIVPLLSALGTVTGVIVGQLGSLLSRTSTVTPSTTNVVNAAPQGAPPGDTTNVTYGGGGGGGRGADLAVPTALVEPAVDAIQPVDDAPGTVPL